MGANGQIPLMQFIEGDRPIVQRLRLWKLTKTVKCLRWFRKKDNHTFLKKRNVKGSWKTFKILTLDALDDICIFGMSGWSKTSKIYSPFSLTHCQTKPTTDWVILPLSHKSDFYKELSSFVMFSFLTFWKMHLTKQWTFSECSALQLQIQLFDLQRIHHLCGGQLWTAPFSIVLKVSL